MDQCPGLELVPCEWADEWTSVLVWNWYHAKGRLIELVIIGQNWCAGRWETIEIMMNELKNKLIVW
jgi:hypothetical protein